MKLDNTPRYRAALAFAAAALMTLGLQAGPAQAAPAGPSLDATTAEALAVDLGSAGSYLDADTGAMVVTVTSEADAQRVRDAAQPGRLDRRHRVVGGPDDEPDRGLH